MTTVIGESTVGDDVVDGVVHGHGLRYFLELCSEVGARLHAVPGAEVPDAVGVGVLDGCEEFPGIGRLVVRFDFILGSLYRCAILVWRRFLRRLLGLGRVLCSRLIVGCRIFGFGFRLWCLDR